MSLYEARFGVAVPYPQVSSLYEALTWGFIHLRLVRNRSTLQNDAGIEGVVADMPRHVSTQGRCYFTKNCRDVPWHVRNRSTLQND